MSNELQELLDMAKRHEISPEEHNAQVRSFAYGNTHFENEAITRADIDEAVKNLNAEAVYL
jgi:hypothetical protein